MQHIARSKNIVSNHERVKRLRIMKDDPRKQALTGISAARRSDAKASLQHLTPRSPGESTQLEPLQKPHDSVLEASS